MSVSGQKPGRWVAAGLGLVLLFAASVLVPVSASSELHPGHLVADGHSSARLVWQMRSIYGNAIPFYPFTTRVRLVDGPSGLRLIGPTSRDTGPARMEVAVQSNGPPGLARLELDLGWTTRTFSLAIASPPGDADADGVPDAAELLSGRDRDAFRQWFAAIAEAQFYRPDPRWEAIHRDCAGLVRFAYKEALRVHDAAWLAQVPYLHQSPPAEVGRYHYPDVPVLGERLFRTRAGPHVADDELAAGFSASASARTLWLYNTVLLGRRPGEAQVGDLLFFRDLNQRSPMHTMILLDPPGLGDQRRVVYHTGPDEAGPGEVRLVRLADLDGHRDSKWHVEESNPNFLGVYRWKILEGGPP